MLLTTTMLELLPSNKSCNWPRGNNGSPVNAVKTGKNRYVMGWETVPLQHPNTSKPSAVSMMSSQTCASSLETTRITAHFHPEPFNELQRALTPGLGGSLENKLRNHQNVKPAVPSGTVQHNCVSARRLPLVVDIN